MKGILLGSGASAGTPALWCHCAVCERARREKGKECRTRSDFLLGEETLLDFGPDIYTQCVKNDVDLTKIKRIFLTHFHEDHFNFADLADSIHDPVTVYASPKAIELILEGKLLYRWHGNPHYRDYFAHCTFTPLQPYQTYPIDGMEVTPLIAYHTGYGEGEWGYSYLIRTQEGANLLYTGDTGLYCAETWAYLRTCGFAADCVICECTYGDMETKDEGHLCFSTLQTMLTRLQTCGILHAQTLVYLNHIAHWNTLSQEEMEQLFSAWQWQVHPGYDGQTIFFG